MNAETAPTPRRLAAPPWLGPAAWTVVALLGVTHLAPLGIIEVLLLAGPLLAVPLGLVVLRDAAPGARRRARTSSVAPAGILVAVSFLLGHGPAATALTLPWLFVTLLLATDAALGVARTRDLDLVATCRLAAIGWLPLAAGAITMTRAGVTAFGITAELVRLTGVHLNFAGFGAAVIASELVRSARRRGTHRRAADTAAMLTVGGAMVVAVGHLTVRVLELVGATSMTAGVIAIGVVSWRMAPRRSAARVLLRVSGLSVFGSMGFALAYSWSLTVGADHLPYATIATVHGSLNAFGFTLCGLLGWLAIARHHPPAGRVAPANVPPPSGESTPNRRRSVAGELFGVRRRRNPRPPDATADHRRPDLEGIPS